MKQFFEFIKSSIKILIPTLTSVVFIGFAFVLSLVIILSLIPVYIENKSIRKTSFIVTQVRINDYVLQTNRSLRKRAFEFSSNQSNLLTFNHTQSIMNSSIQYALEQQLQAGDKREKFNISILQMTSYTENLKNMRVLLDFLIVYTRECRSCNSHRRSIIFKQLCSNNQLLTPIRFSIQSANLSYILSDPLVVYTPSIPIENIEIITRIVSSIQTIDTINPIPTINETLQISNKFLGNNYTLTVTTAKSNYLATLDETITKLSANQNDGPISLSGSVTMFAELAKIIERQTQFTNGSNVFNITINQIVLQFWYSNSTVQMIVDFSITFSTSCDYNCMHDRNNQLTKQLESLINIQIHIQPANLTDGQVQILKGGSFVLYDYSLTTQVIANFTGTIIRAIPPTLTIIY